jgi:hypothetical protein
MLSSSSSHSPLLLLLLSFLLSLPPSFCAAVSGAPTRDRHTTSTRRQSCKGCCWAWRCVTSCCTGPCRCGNMNPPPISRLCTLSRKPHSPGGRGAHLLYTIPLPPSLPPILYLARLRALDHSLARASARAVSLSLSPSPFSHERPQLFIHVSINKCSLSCNHCQKVEHSGSL